MKPIEKNELFTHLSGFLKNKGIELKEGSYAQGIQKSCSLLTDAINASQQGLGRAKVEVDKRLEQMRQIIHEKTAPKAPGGAQPGAAQARGSSSSRKAAAGRKKPAATNKKAGASKK